MGFASYKKDAVFAAGLLRKKPFSCLLQVTNRCNMECSFCDFWPNVAAKKDELTAAEFQRIGDELGELGCFLISIEGGDVRGDVSKNRVAGTIGDDGPLVRATSGSGSILVRVGR